MHAAEDYKLSKQKILDVIYLFQKKKDNKKLIDHKHKYTFHTKIIRKSLKEFQQQQLQQGRKTIVLRLLRTIAAKRERSDVLTHLNAKIKNLVLALILSMWAMFSPVLGTQTQQNIL